MTYKILEIINKKIVMISIEMYQLIQSVECLILIKDLENNNIIMETKRRAKPMTAKAGVTKGKRRYACGGKMK